jgi:hypothetical protein
MIKSHRHSLIISFMILCLSISSLVLPGFFHTTHQGMLAPADENSEAQDHIFQPETEEGFYLPPLVGVFLIGLMIIRMHMINLNFWSIRLPPQSPPPKFT